MLQIITIATMFINVAISEKPKTNNVKYEIFSIQKETSNRPVFTVKYEKAPTSWTKKVN